MLIYLDLRLSSVYVCLLCLCMCLVFVCLSAVCVCVIFVFVWCVCLLSRLWFLWPDEKFKRSRNRCGCLGGCRFFAGSSAGLDFFRLEEITPSSSSAFSCTSGESDMCYGQSLLQPGELIVTKETPKLSEGKNINHTLIGWLFLLCCSLVGISLRLMLIGWFCREECGYP